jgi:hypothetical protein
VAVGVFFEDFHIDRNLDTVLGALRRLGIEAEKKGRNDAWRSKEMD